MNAGAFIALGGLVVFVVAAAIVHTRRSRRHGSQRRRGSATGQTFAIHDPCDDPHWLAYSQRKSARKAKRRKVWAAGTAGAVGAGSTDGGVGCGAGCGGGGGCGGG